MVSGGSLYRIETKIPSIFGKIVILYNATYFINRQLFHLAVLEKVIIGGYTCVAIFTFGIKHLRLKNTVGLYSTDYNPREISTLHLFIGGGEGGRGCKTLFQIL